MSAPRYRPEIDGLRAIAVWSVVAFHAFPRWIPGGFVGVDVFFVISGFLISTIILENLDRGTFRFAEFYARRIRRLFPALLLVLVASYALGWLVLLAHEYRQLGEDIVASAGFVANLALSREGGYFDRTAETQPLLHLWSLGVEEQFYIVWPVVLWCAWRRRLNLPTITILVAAASFYLSVTRAESDRVAAFYSPQTRFWELLSGCLLAWVALYGRGIGVAFSRLDLRFSRAIHGESREAGGASLANLSSVVGCCLLALGFVRIHQGVRFPGTWALVPVLGTVLIIAAGARAWINRTILSHPLAVWFGLISFPLYLWHWMLLSFARIVESQVPSASVRLAAVTLSVVLAGLTYELIERPLRFVGRSRAKVAVLVLLMVIVGGVGYGTRVNDGLEFRVRDFARISNAIGEWQYPGSLKPRLLDGRTFRFQKSGREDTTLFVGDSTVEQYYVRVDELIREDGSRTNSVVFATEGGCFPVPGLSYENDERHRPCRGLMESARRVALRDSHVRNVVIGGQWNSYLSATNPLGDFGYGSQLYEATLARLSSYIRDLTGAGKRVFLVLSIPTGPEFDPRFMVRRGFADFPRLLVLREGGLERSVLEVRHGIVQNDLRLRAAAAGATVIQPMDFICAAARCPSADDRGEPLYKDSSHLRPTYVRRNAIFIDPTVR